MLPHQSVFLGDHRGNVYIKKIDMNNLSSRTQLKILRKFPPPVGIRLDRMMNMSYLTS